MNILQLLSCISPKLSLKAISGFSKAMDNNVIELNSKNVADRFKSGADPVLRHVFTSSYVGFCHKRQLNWFCQTWSAEPSEINSTQN